MISNVFVLECISIHSNMSRRYLNCIGMYFNGILMYIEGILMIFLYNSKYFNI
jgi:hypothetical protein